MGLFVTIEGGDGSGKGTQSELLRAYLSDERGKLVTKISFPRYGNDSAYYAERYLNGDYGQADEVPADLGVLPFAIDRFAASSEIRTHLENPEAILVADRYMASNLAHQGTKISSSLARKKFYERTMKTEYEVLGIPRPNINIVLLMPSELAQANVDKKAARSYTTLTRDIHEADKGHLDRAKANYEELCRLYPDEFTAVQCTDKSGVLRSIDDIQAEIRQNLGL